MWRGKREAKLEDGKYMCVQSVHPYIHTEMLLVHSLFCFVTRVQPAVDGLIPLLGALLCSSSKSCPGLSHSRGVSAMLDTTGSSSCEDPSDLLLCPLQTPS